MNIRILDATSGNGSDAVNSPDHYNQGDIECIDAIQAAMTPDEFAGFCKGNVIKYVWRARYKGGLESLRKARWYIDRLIVDIEEREKYGAI